MGLLWNRYGPTSSTIGGGIPVWVEIPKDAVGGALLLNKLRLGEVLSSGSPVEYDHKTHNAKILKCFKIEAVEVVDTNSIITLLKTARTPALYIGMNLMATPSAITGTGKGVLISAVDEATPNAYKVTVATASIDALAVGKYLVEADKVGTGAKMYAIPNNFTKEDTVGGDQNTLGIPRGEKYLYENTIPALPDVVKNNIVSVARVEFAWFPEEKV